MVQARGSRWPLILIALFAFRLWFGLSREFFFEDETQIFLIGFRYYATGDWPFFGPDVVWTKSEIPGALQGVLVGLPLRIFDRNQGEKLRTMLDVTRNERLAEVARMQVFADVDTAYEAVQSTVALLRPYRDQYLAQATRVRDTVQFSYQRGGASLIEFLQAQQEYRSVQISYVNLTAAYLNAINQLNAAVGQEVIP